MGKPLRLQEAAATRYPPRVSPHLLSELVPGRAVSVPAPVVKAARGTWWTLQTAQCACRIQTWPKKIVFVVLHSLLCTTVRNINLKNCHYIKTDCTSSADVLMLFQKAKIKKMLCFQDFTFAHSSRNSFQTTCQASKAQPEPHSQHTPSPRSTH